MNEAVSRTIKVILAADVAGFSRLVAADEEATLMRLSLARSTFEGIIKRYRGRVFNTAGDAVRAEFQSATDAVQCAVELQRSTADFNGGAIPGRELRFRIGISIGDVVLQDGDLLGDGVNLAEQLEAVAPVGGICVARSVHDAVAGKVDLTFREIAPIPAGQRGSAPIQVYKAVLDPAAQAEMDDAAPGASTASGGRGFWLGLAGLALLVFVGTMAAVRYFEPGGRPRPVPTPPPATTTTATAPATPPAAQNPPAPPASKAEPPAAPAAPAKQAEPTPSPPSPPAARESSPPSAAPPPAKDTAKDTDWVRLDALAAELKRNWETCNAPGIETAIAGCRSLLTGKSELSAADKALANFNLGKALRSKGERTAALEALTESIRATPRADAHNLRGIAHHEASSWDQAIADFGEAIKLDAKHGEAYNNRAWTLYKAGRAKEAVADADTATRLLKDAAYAWDTKGHVQEAAGDKSAAIEAYRKAIALDPKSDDSRAGLKRLGVTP